MNVTAPVRESRQPSRRARLRCQAKIALATRKSAKLHFDQNAFCAAKVRGKALPMSLAIKHDDIPLTTTTDGVVVVTGTRVSLDLIVAAFRSGATADDIAHQ